MDKVYSNAMVTLFAAAGEDADFGLPGVGHAPGRKQPSASVHGSLLVSTLGLPERCVRKLRWATRGWTYQEGVFATKRLVFTEEQVHYECKSMECCESVALPEIDEWRKYGTAG